MKISNLVIVICSIVIVVSLAGLTYNVITKTGDNSSILAAQNSGVQPGETVDAAYFKQTGSTCPNCGNQLTFKSYGFEYNSDNQQVETGTWYCKNCNATYSCGSGTCRRDS